MLSPSLLPPRGRGRHAWVRNASLHMPYGCPPKTSDLELAPRFRLGARLECAMCGAEGDEAPCGNLSDEVDHAWLSLSQNSSPLGRSLHRSTRSSVGALDVQLNLWQLGCPSPPCFYFFLPIPLCAASMRDLKNQNPPHTPPAEPPYKVL